MEQINLLNDIGSIMIFVSFAIVFIGGVAQGRRKGLTLSNALGVGFRAVQKMMNAQAKTDTQEREAAKVAESVSMPGDGAMVSRQEFREIIRELIGEYTRQTTDMATERATDIAELRTTQREQEASIVELRTDLTASQQQVATLTTDLDAEKAKVSLLQSELKTTKEERDELNKRVDEMQKAHDRERAEDRAEHERRIGELLEQIQSKEARIKDLERQLDELRKAKTGSLTPVTAEENSAPEKGMTDE